MDAETKIKNEDANCQDGRGADLETSLDEGKKLEASDERARLCMPEAVVCGGPSEAISAARVKLSVRPRASFQDS